MKRKLLSRVSAVAMASAMMVSMFGMSVSANETSNPQNVTIHKNIEKNEDLYVPYTDFKFTVESASGNDLTTNTGNNTIYSGPEGGVKMVDDTIQSRPAGSDIGLSSVSLSDTASLQVNTEVFTSGADAKPGVFRYIVRETAGSYEGVTYDNSAKYFDVFVDSSENGTLSVVAYTFTDWNNADSGKDDGTFTNSYDYNKPGDDLNDLTIVKEVTGNQGNRNTPFEFTIKVQGAQGELYYMAIIDTDATENPVMKYTLTSGKPEEFTLTDNQRAVIYGLSKTDTFEVTEESYTSDGYTTTVNVDGDDVTQSGNTVSGDAADNDVTVTYTNDKEGSTPTGIIMNIAPYIILVAFAGIAALVFLRRRNREF